MISYKNYTIITTITCSKLHYFNKFKKLPKEKKQKKTDFLPVNFGAFKPGPLMVDRKYIKWAIF